jgi:hypothetical protein
MGSIAGPESFLSINRRDRPKKVSVLAEQI